MTERKGRPVTVYLPEELVARLDRYWRMNNLANRKEAITKLLDEGLSKAGYPAEELDDEERISA